MKLKTSELSGVSLVQAVAKAEGHQVVSVVGDTVFTDRATPEGGTGEFHPTTGPAHGLPILKKAGIKHSGDLVADMRVFVSKVLGDEVELQPL